MKKINLVLLCASLLLASLGSGVVRAAPENDIAILSARYWDDAGESVDIPESGLTSLPPYQHVHLAFLSPGATSGLEVSVSPQLNNWRENEDIASPKGRGASASFTLASGQSAVITVTGNFNETELSREFSVAAESGVSPPSASVSVTDDRVFGSFRKDISLTLKAGEETTLYYEVTPEGVTDQVAVFADDPNIVSVGQPIGDSVTIRALRTGKSDVTFMTKESGETAVCRVTVEAAASAPTADSGGGGGGGCDAGSGAGALFLAVSLFAMRALGFLFRRIEPD